MNKPNWKCPNCGYLNVVLDTECASCGHVQGEPVQQPANPRAIRKRNGCGGCFAGCAVFVLLLGIFIGWVYLTPTGRELVLKRVMIKEMEVATSNPVVDGENKIALDKQGKEIERLVGVLKSSTDAEVSTEAWRQLNAVVSAYTDSYAGIYGYHQPIPGPIKKAVDFSFEFTLANPEAEPAPTAMSCPASTLTSWGIKDIRKYEPQLLQLLAVGNQPPPDEHQDLSTDVDSMKQRDAESRREGALMEQNAEIHEKELKLLEASLRPGQFVPRSRLISPGADQPANAWDLDVEFAKELTGKLRAINGNEQAQLLAGRIENELHELDVKAKVKGS